MIEKTLTVKNRAGIHTRPAAIIAKTAAKFESKIFFEKETMKINAKSIMGVITLGSPYQDILKMTCIGPDETEQAEAMEKLFENRFQEE